MEPSPNSPTGSPATLDPKRASAVLAILSGVALMVTYVETMIIPALRNFEIFYGGASLSLVSWILAAYLLVGTAVTPLASKLGDLYGKKRVLLAVLVIYAISVTVAGFTPDLGAAAGLSRPNQIYLLIAVRGVQGIGMAMFPLAFAMIGEEFPRDRVAGAQGAIAAMFAVGASLGLFGGAWVTQTFGWQVTYHTVIPFAILMTIVSALYLAESHVRLSQRLDVPGAALLGASLALLLLGLTQGPTWGWGSWTGATYFGVSFGVPELLIGAALLGAGFVVWERISPQPIVDFKKMAERNIWVSNASGLLAGIAMFLMFFSITTIAELPAPDGLGLTVLQFGLLSLPTTTSNMVVGPLVGKGIGKAGPRPFLLLAGTLITGGGLFLTVFHATIPELVVGPIPIFLGIIMVFIAITNVVVVTSRPGEAGIQTGMNQTFRNLGTAIGPVIGAVILSSFTAVFLLHPAPGISVPVTLPSNTGFQIAFLGIAVLGIIIAGLGLLVRNYRFALDGTRVELGAPRSVKLPVAASPAPVLSTTSQSPS